jgi:futalosine hydrolase
LNWIRKEPTVDRRVLLVVAARVEWEAVCRGVDADAVVVWPSRPWAAVDLGPCDAVLTGVGKGNAAAGVAMALDPERHRAVVGVGIAGALPRAQGMLSIGSVVLASDSVYADEGVETPTRFQSLAEMGFPADDRLDGPAAGPEDGHGFADACDALRAQLAAQLTARGIEHHAGAVATVSICSGTDELARAVAERTGAIAEGMEGAAGRMAAVHASRRAGRAVPFAEVRVISNNTGNYDEQVWKIRDALQGVQRVVAAIAQPGPGR